MNQSLDLTNAEKAYDILESRLNTPRGYEVVQLEYILFLLNDFTPEYLPKSERLVLAEKTLQASWTSGQPLAASERAEAVFWLLENGISNSRHPEFPEATPEQVKKFLLSCDIELFTAMVDVVAANNQRIYAPEFDEFDFENVKVCGNGITAIQAEEQIYALLSGFDGEYDINAPEYEQAWDLMMDTCRECFPELHEALLDPGTDLVFSKPNGDYVMLYFNADSVAGGQFVECPFDENDISAIQELGDEYIEAFCDRPQYLSDVNSPCFFETVFEMLELHRDGFFIANDIHKACEYIQNELYERGPRTALDAAMPALDEQIKSAEAICQGVQPADHKPKEPESAR